MSISASPVQQAIGVWSAGLSFTVTLTNFPVDGNGIVLCFTAAASSNTISSISQTGATWQKLKSNSVGRNAEIWYCLNVASAGKVITVNLNAATLFSDANASEWSGLELTALLAAGPTNGGSGNSTTPATGSVTPTTGRECIIFGGVRLGGNLTSGPAGFTALTSPDSSRDYPGYLVVSSASGSYSTSWVSASGAWEAAIGVLYAPASSGTPIGACLGNALKNGSPFASGTY